MPDLLSQEEECCYRRDGACLTDVTWHDFETVEGTGEKWGKAKKAAMDWADKKLGVKKVFSDWE